MKALDEFGTNKDFTGICKLWIATGGKRCTDVLPAASSFLRMLVKPGVDSPALLLVKAS